MTIKKRTISPRITNEVRQELSEAYGTANAGAQVALASWTTLRERTLEELDDIFEEAEWIFIDKLYQTGSFDAPSAINKQELLIRVRTAIETSDTDGLVPSYPLQIVDKIRNLTAAQQLYLVEWACMPERLR